MNQISFKSYGYQLAFTLILVAAVGLVRPTVAQDAVAVEDPTELSDLSLEEQTPSASSEEAAADEPAAESAEPESTENESNTAKESVEEEPVVEEPVATEEPVSEASEPVPTNEESNEEEATTEDDESGEAAEELDEAEAEGIDYAGLVERAPDFFAVTHPAVVHFPIALWIFGAFFIVVGWIIPSWGQQIPLACLLFGTISGIVATVSGWWYADFNGYGDWKEVDWTDVFFQHRWLGVALTVVSIFLSMIAIYAARTESRTAGFLWKFGLILLALGVGYEGHLGGALIHSTSIEEAFVEWINPSE